MRFHANPNDHEATTRPQGAPSTEAVHVAFDVVTVLIIVAACVGTFRKIVRLWWMWDDPYHLILLGKHGFTELLFSRELWRAHTSHLYTPLLFLSLKTDFALFGYNARAFYIHQLVAVCITAVLLYALLRQAVEPISAGAATLIVMLGPAFVATVPQLMSRHYFEGMAFALGATIAFVRRRHALSAILYFCSILAKEVFVPVPLVLLAIHPRRWRDLLPHGIALLAYTVLRIAMVGPRLEPYGYTARPSQWPFVIASAPVRMIRSFAVEAGGVGLAVVVVICAAVVVLFALDRSRRTAVLVGALAALLPVLPVSIQMQSRYALVAWLLASCAAAVLLKRYAVVLIPLVLICARVQLSHTMRESQRMSDEARVFAGMTNSDMLVLPLTPPATLNDLRKLTHSSGTWLYDEQPLCSGRISAPNLFEWSDQSRSVRRMQNVAAAGRCGSIRSAPLSVHFTSSTDRLYWVFGPYGEGSYNMIFSDGARGFEVLRAAGFRLPGVNTLALRVRYDSPAGWSTYSPDFTINLARGDEVSWHR